MLLIENDGVPEATALEVLGVGQDKYDHWQRDWLRRQSERAVHKLATLVRQRLDSAADPGASPDPFIEEVTEALRRALSQPSLDPFLEPAGGNDERPAAADATGASHRAADQRDQSEGEVPAADLEEIAP
jgi:hypothetical protein